MKKFLFVFQESDLDFLNETEVDISFPNDLGPTDSGWRDMETGARIVCSGERIILKPATEEQEAFIRLKFLDRLEEIRGVEQSGSSLGS